MSNVIMCSECKKCDGDRCNYFDNDSDRESTIACILFEPKNPTVFQQITASPEVLAEKLVIPNNSGRGYLSIIIDEGVDGYGWYKTYTEAIAATLEKLKEVGE